MGALHEGHLSLMKKAKAECDFLVVSLFVNPLQFGPTEDFKVYPRELASDRKKAHSAGADLLWIPSEKDLYPPGFQSTVTVSKISQPWEGIFRPDHFKGVSTIVAKLLQITRPDRLYLGQKDYQQSCVIRQMIRDLHFETQMRVCATCREKDGLAMSSRNARLSTKARENAAILYRALQAAKNQVRSGERDAKCIIQTVTSLLESIPGLKYDYVALCDIETLEPLERLADCAVLLAAIHIGRVRLIDNIRLKIPKK